MNDLLNPLRPGVRRAASSSTATAPSSRKSSPAERPKETPPGGPARTPSSSVSSPESSLSDEDDVPLKRPAKSKSKSKLKDRKQSASPKKRIARKASTDKTPPQGKEESICGQCGKILPSKESLLSHTLKQHPLPGGEMSALYFSTEYFFSNDPLPRCSSQAPREAEDQTQSQGETGPRRTPGIKVVGCRAESRSKTAGHGGESRGDHTQDIGILVQDLGGFAKVVGDFNQDLGDFNQDLGTCDKGLGRPAAAAASKGDAGDQGVGDWAWQR